MKKIGNLRIVGLGKGLTAADHRCPLCSEPRKGTKLLRNNHIDCPRHGIIKADLVVALPQEEAA